MLMMRICKIAAAFLYDHAVIHMYDAFAALFYSKSCVLEGVEGK